MVQFNHSLTFATNALPVRRSVLRVIQDLIDLHQADLQEMRMGVECEVDEPVGDLLCQAMVEDCLREILQTAIARSSPGSQLTISAIRTVRGVEIEIADADSVTDDLPTNAFSRCPRWSSRIRRGASQPWANSATPDVYHTRCPQGGQAWTLVMKPRMAQVRAA